MTESEHVTLAEQEECQRSARNAATLYAEDVRTILSWDDSDCPADLDYLRRYARIAFHFAARVVERGLRESEVAHD